MASQNKAGAPRGDRAAALARGDGAAGLAHLTRLHQVRVCSLQTYAWSATMQVSVQSELAQSALSSQRSPLALSGLHVTSQRYLHRTRRRRFGSHHPPSARASECKFADRCSTDIWTPGQNRSSMSRRTGTPRPAYISIGGITKHVRAVELSMRLAFAS